MAIDFLKIENMLKLLVIVWTSEDRGAMPKLERPLKELRGNCLSYQFQRGR